MKYFLITIKGKHDGSIKTRKLPEYKAYDYIDALAFIRSREISEGRETFSYIIEEVSK